MSAVVNPSALLTPNQVARGYTNDDMSNRQSSNIPTQQDFINIFGPAGADVKLDKNRFGRMNRVHIPDVLRGPNQWMTDRIDGFITDTTNSPYTTLILPYKYIETPDASFKWNVWSFDEGLASRVPYESAARTLTQSKREFAGFTVRQGLAMTMEHNFMMTPEGRQNFQNQLRQIVHSIQYSNDLDVHMALVNAPSYFAQVREKYYRDEYNVEKEIRDYVDSFGFLQKNMNGLDILIEDAKNVLRGWGADEPDFILLNSKLTFQITMMPEKTQYMTQGIDGVRRLRDGPNITRYRGLNIIRSKAFSMEQGAAPRDLLRRRVRVAEFYLVPFGTGAAGTGVDGSGEGAMSSLARGEMDAASGSATVTLDTRGASDAQNDASGMVPVGGGDTNGELQLYDEGCDSWCTVPFSKLYKQCRNFIARCNEQYPYRPHDDPLRQRINENFGGMLVLRPNVEHWMLGLIMGKGGLDELGATLWGQTELSCFDDGQHGIWGMSYKYHEKAMVFNERNLVRIWDVAYDGYVGGKDVTILDWSSDEDMRRFIAADAYLNKPYTGPSIVVIPMPDLTTLPSPVPIGNIANPLFDSNAHQLATSDIFCEDMTGMIQRLGDKIGSENLPAFKLFISLMFEQLNMNRNNSAAKDACSATVENEATAIRLAYSGTYKYRAAPEGVPLGTIGFNEISGCGHHGPDYVGVASLRAGKGYRMISQPTGTRLL
jgi:hypothetical protein